ncbi:hypothetical protein [Clavibacter michiganensis]|uniref:hypothetical protein n=1 Tax=Clavibacter michiganensis TaxID=28447 RepID=UPI00136671E4|nr:hypothetical protein [Clavibacter michiganensis]
MAVSKVRELDVKVLQMPRIAAYCDRPESDECDGADAYDDRGRDQPERARDDGRDTHRCAAAEEGTSGRGGNPGGYPMMKKVLELAPER